MFPQRFCGASFWHVVVVVAAAGTLVQTYKLYAPYGHYGSYPVPTTIKDPGTCTWVQTRQVEKLGFAVNENGKFAGGSHWVVHQGVGQWVIDEPIQGAYLIVPLLKCSRIRR